VEFNFQLILNQGNVQRALGIINHKRNFNSHSKKIKVCYALSSCALTTRFYFQTSFYNEGIESLVSFQRLLCISMRLAHQFGDLGARMLFD